MALTDWSGTALQLVRAVGRFEMRNPLTLEAFAAWCETKPADEVYCYTDSGHCAFAQYLSWLGFVEPSVGSRTYSDGDGPAHALPAGLDSAVRGEPRTYGALAARLRASA